MIQGDQYVAAITGRYFENISDTDIAIKLNCDERTVRRNRNRLVKKGAENLRC